MSRRHDMLSDPMPERMVNCSFTATVAEFSGSEDH
jgi:hypothetical protein